ncbi:MAG: 1-deoxy-D-xylulose-5-phosphate reductoisomerase [Clostridiales bacterium]|nr:1-deoxy-D-xylulose-5-phosphate reductoisomerase [Clostridiales bacterium]
MKKISILGSTGSIGTQALDIISKNRDKFSVKALTCGKRVELLAKQIEAFRPELVCVEDEKDALELNKRFPKLEVLWGESGLQELAAKTDCDMVLNALVGMRGLVPTYEAIKSGKDIALANKETLVTGGKLIIDEAKKNGVSIIPVDSEHSAIFQALQGNSDKDIKRIYLTASGGPFRGYTLEQLEEVTLEQALKHPNWSMGNKITIDSATMMNKGLEVIEARWLFDVEPERIEVIVHKESIIHSMVEYKDHSIIAQLGVPDMRVPISYALTYPERIQSDVPSVDFFSLGSLTFEKADTKVFKCLKMAYEALEKGKSYPVVLNAANEVLVQQFLEKKISFIDIQNTIERVMNEHVPVNIHGLSDILSIDNEIRGKLE